MRARLLFSFAAAWLISFAPFGHPAHAGTTIQGIVLPNRMNADLSARVRRVIHVLALDIAADEVPDPRSSPHALSLAPMLERGKSLALEAQLDQAGQVFDDALTQGLEGFDRLLEPAELISVHLERASIYFAKDQEESAQSLVDRAHRYDPTLVLAGEELRPKLRAALAAAQARQGLRPALAVGDLGDGCRAADIVVAVRPVEDGIELIRFDHCVEVTSAVSASPAQDDEAAHALAGATANPILGRSQAPVDHPSRSSTFRTTKIALTAGAVVLASTGGVLAGLARSRYDDLLADCGVAGQCAPERYRSAMVEERVGYTLIGVGATAALTALVVWMVEKR